MAQPINMETIFKTNYIVYMFAQTSIVDKSDNPNELENVDENWIEAHNNIPRDQFLQYFNEDCYNYNLPAKKFNHEEAWHKTQTEWLEYLKSNVKEHVRAWMADEYTPCNCHACLNM